MAPARTYSSMCAFRGHYVSSTLIPYLLFARPPTTIELIASLNKVGWIRVSCQIQYILLYLLLSYRLLQQAEEVPKVTLKDHESADQG